MAVDGPTFNGDSGQDDAASGPAVVRKSIVISMPQLAECQMSEMALPRITQPQQA
jgi:hypothetical protein